MKKKYCIMSFGNKKNRIKIVHLKKPMKNGLAGIAMANFLKENIALVVDKSEESDIDYSFACLACSHEGKGPRILFQNDLFFDIKRGVDEARTALFHELGHYCYGDYSVDVGDEERIAAVQDGEVLEMEKRADAFAAAYLGIEKTIHGLLQLKERIIKHVCENEAKTAAIEELNRRIAILEKEG